MDYLPIFMKISGRDCLLVGAGAVGARKAALLIEAGAKLRVVSPQAGAAIREHAAAGRVTLSERGFEEGDLDGAWLVIAATADRALNARVAAAAEARRIPVNVVDTPALCGFVLPSILDRSPLVAAISTGGAAPVLARLLRARLETLVPAAFGRLALIAGRFRERVKTRIAGADDRRRFWERVLDGPIAELVYAGREREAEQALEAALADEALLTGSGEVYLIGAGPGDPDLLTFRALRLLQRADVVVHDRLVSKEVLALARRDADRVYAGKKRDHHFLPQETINQLLVRFAREGRRVARLKGGDPFIFGRGGEEIDTLAAEGIPFQVVPGITAAAGCGAYAGIPLTHRDHAQGCVFVTGHLRDGSVDLNWPALAQPRQTLVFYMGLHGLPVICRQLVAHGMPETTPAALVEQGTTARQRVITGTLATLPERVATQSVRAPTLIIVGEVVALRERLSWFEPAEGRVPAGTGTASGLAEND